MAKTLLEVFTEQNTKQQQKKRKAVNRQARGKGSRTEALLLRQLEEQGYEVRRTHLSLFPDIIAWSENELLLIEVKQRADTKNGISNALSVFRGSVKSVTKWHKDAKVLCYLRVNNTWSAYECADGVTAQVQSIV
jgi:Holliday junction resolvase